MLGACSALVDTATTALTIAGFGGNQTFGGGGGRSKIAIKNRLHVKMLTSGAGCSTRQWLTVVC